MRQLLLILFGGNVNNVILTVIAIVIDNDIDSLSNLVEFKVKGIKVIVIVLFASTFGEVEPSYIDQSRAKRFEEALVNLEAHVYRVAKGDNLEKKFETI